MFLVNRFGRVVQFEDEKEAQYKLQGGRFREASDQEVAKFFAEREEATVGPDSVYYQAPRPAPDGYGMSRDILKMELAARGVELAETNKNQKVGLLYNYPNSVINMRNDVRLCYTMFESDRIPEDWPDYLSAADEVLVPSKWCHDVFLKDGVKTTVVPLGYNARIFSYHDRSVPIDNNEPFTFIQYDSFNYRKGFGEVFKAFTQEFSKDENVRLILKTIHEHTAVPVLKSQFPQIEVLRGQYSEQELSDLLKRAHCMVYPSRGEGFGITPLEAMATGLPAIVPNAHGISEYFNANYMLEVKVGSTCPGLNPRFKGQNIGDMVICDVDHLRKQMRYAFNHQAEMKEMGRQAAEYVKSFTYGHTADRLAEIINRWKKTDVIKRQESKYLQVERV